ncbi:unnamed protein product [Rotaria sp. Silwood2]|nr:unnamed protein product [Rotaria sp. Silwood2]
MTKSEPDKLISNASTTWKQVGITMAGDDKVKFESDKELSNSYDLAFNSKNQYFYVADYDNGRIQRYSVNSDNNHTGSCSEICVDKNENICVSDGDQLAVWKFNKNGKIVAGGNDYGQASNQLFHPIGVTVCDGNGKGDGLNQLNHPCSVVIDSNEKQIYVDDGFNGRVVRSSTGAKKGEIIVNDDKNSNKPNERSRAGGITFDADGNLCYRP